MTSRRSHETSNSVVIVVGGGGVVGLLLGRQKLDP
jgi:hypothetical protein